MLEILEFGCAALFAVGIFGFTSNAWIALAMYYGRKVILTLVREHLA